MTIASRNQSRVFYANFLNQDGSAATVNGTPTVTLVRNTGGAIEWIFSGVAMTLLAGSKYMYPYHIPNNIRKDSYLVIYDAEYSDGTSVRGSEILQIVDNDFFAKKGGGMVVQRATIPVEWKPEEKKIVLKTLYDLTQKVDSLSILYNDLGKISKRVALLSGKLSENKKIDKRIGSNMMKMSKEINELREHVVDSKVIEKLDGLKSVLDEAHFSGSERMPRVLSELDDIRANLNDFMDAFVKSLPTKKIERELR